MARLFVSAVCVVGGAVIVSSLPSLVTTRPIVLGLLLALSLPASTVKVSFPRSVSTLTLCQVLAYITLLVLGPSEAVLVEALGAWSQCTFRSRYKNPMHQTLFSIAALACAIQLAGACFVRLGGRPGDWEPSTAMVPFVAAATVFFAVNSGLVAAAIGLSTEQSGVRIWHEAFFWSWPTYLFGAGLAAAVVTGIESGGLWLAPLLAMALWSTFQNLRAYLARFNDSVTDPLTALVNQRFIVPHAAREIERARRDGTKLAIMVADLDGFKSINDTYGHAVGDNVLRQVAQCLQQFSRSCDVCGRHGGDEFIVVLPVCDKAGAERRGRELQAAVSGMRLAFAPTFNVSLGVSIGTAVFPDDAETFERLLEIADARMYRNKHNPKISLVKPPTRLARTVHS
jgi:diguanylate cyclase (GGDEF)-like protein